MSSQYKYYPGMAIVILLAIVSFATLLGLAGIWHLP
jgi:hypothetical protein